MFGATVSKPLRLTVAVWFAAAAALPPGAFLCVDTAGHARFEVAAFDQLSPVDHPGHRDEGLPDCPGGGDHSQSCHDYRLGVIDLVSRTTAASCPSPSVSFMPFVPIDDAFATAAFYTPAACLDVGDPPDCRPQRVALRI